MRNPQIQEVLSALGVQMDVLARELGWSYEQLAEYATTSKNVSLDVIDAIAGKLKVDSSVFFNDRYKSLTK